MQVASLKALGLNIRRAKLKSGKEQKFYVTDARTSEKVCAGQAARAAPALLTPGRRRGHLEATLLRSHPPWLLPLLQRRSACLPMGSLGSPSVLAKHACPWCASVQAPLWLWSGQAVAR